MVTLLCGVGYCPHCAKEEPRTCQPFLVYGSRKYHVYEAEHNVYGGFTPHIYHFIKSDEEKVIIDKRCSFCGYDFIWQDYKKDYDYKPVKDWQRTSLSIRDWNALIAIHNNKDDQYWV